MGPVNTVGTVVALVLLSAYLIGMQICTRLLIGRHYRKATSKELRWYSGFFLFIPIWGAVFVYFGHSYLDRTGAVGIWFCAMGGLLVAYLWLWFWARFVPAFVSWWLAGFVWVITLWFTITSRFA